MIREEALNVLMNVAPLLRDGTGFLGQEHEEQFHKAYEMAMDALRQPERKKGKWNFVGDQMFECTECGTCYTQRQFQQMKVLITDPDFPRFCPMCGADMRKDKKK